MDTPISNISTEFDEPIIFRTTDTEVYESTLKSGSIWLRSDQYYRDIEDKVRKDSSEGANVCKTTIPLKVMSKNNVQLELHGDGQIGQLIQPHYIMSLHGTSISSDQLTNFGSCTFGIKSISKLSAEVLYRSSNQIKCHGYRYGQVSYQYTSLSLSNHTIGSAAIAHGDPPIYINSINTDVLRKNPLAPFIEQDEWRVVVFTNEYINDDPMAPLKINVAPSHFYPYLLPKNGCVN